MTTSLTILNRGKYVVEAIRLEWYDNMILS